MKTCANQITRRELFKEMVSKDTVKKVMTAWYGFREPFSEDNDAQKKKSSLLETVKRADMKYLKKNGKEGSKICYESPVEIF
jgi:hypothetical protein